MQKYNILFLITFFSLFACKNQAKNEKAEQPNIIFIMTDDHAKQAISIYDTSLIQTPNIDRLADNGIVFNNAFVTNSICAPSRAVILTGNYSHINGVKDNNVEFDSSQVTFPKLLQKSGYQTSIVGKWHLKSQPAGFDHWSVLPGQGNYYNPHFIENGKDSLHHGYVTDIITEKAIKWLDERDKEKPFMLMVQHKAPHRNWMPSLDKLNQLHESDFEPPSTFYDNYKGREHLRKQQLTVSEHMDIVYDLKMPCDTCTPAEINKWTHRAYEYRLSRMTPDQRERWQKGYQEEIANYKQVIRNNESFDKWKLNRYLQDYLRCIMSVDESIGEIIDYVESKGLSDNTIIVYTSDQGFFLGEHGLFDKRYMYEESFQTPLIMQLPKHYKTQGSSEDLVMNLDFAPTFLSLAGVAPPETMQGTSLMPILTGDNNLERRNAVYYHYYENVFGVPEHYGIRTDRYKLIHFKTNPESWELYDLKNDPKETDNRYGDTLYQEIVKVLKEDLTGLQKEYGIIND